MRNWILTIRLWSFTIIALAQQVDSTYGKWWGENRVYKTFSVEQGKSYQVNGDSYYNFWLNGKLLPVIQNNQDGTILYVPINSGDNNQIYAESVDRPSCELRLDQAGSTEDSLKSVSGFQVKKYFDYQEYYSKETIGPEQLLTNSSISKTESWGLKPTHYQQIPLRISKDTLVQQIELNIKNLGYANDLEILLDGQSIRVFENLKSYEVINFDIGRDKSLSNSSIIEIKSKGDPHQKFSVVGLQLTGRVATLPLGLFSLNGHENRLFIPCGANDSELKILDWQDSLYYIPQLGKSGWGFYIRTNQEGKIFTTITQPVQKIDLDSVQEITFNDTVLKKREFLILVAEEILKNSKAVEILEDYISFRKEKVGGGFKINWMNYESIYHQFGFGHKDSYVGLFNFFRYLKSKDLKPRIVWLIGKGFGQNFKGQPNHLIPSYGFPASDFLLVNDLEESQYSMVARLAVSNGNELVEYLHKIMEYERMELGSKDTPNWKKEVLHIAGGKTVEELDENIAILQNSWNSDLNQVLGMKLAELHKPLLDGNSGNLYGEILNRLNRGLGIRVFLGHGGITSTEIGLDNPDLLSMGKKYPFMMDLGCQTGDIFTDKNSLSERFTLALNGGAIGYIGSSGYGYSSGFRIFLRQFYWELSRNLSNLPMGDIFLLAIKPLQKNSFYGSQILGHQLNYHGDPFVRLFNSSGPDYTVSNVSSSIASSSNEIRIQGEIINLGRFQEDTIEIITHWSDVELKRDTLVIKGEKIPFQNTLLNPFKESFNQGTLSIACRQIFGANKLQETDTSNNYYLKEAFTWRRLADLKYPINHSIIHPKDFLGLIFQANYPGEYFIELDTTNQFFHPQKFFQTITKAPEMLRIEVDPDQLIENQRYYWRVNQDKTSTFFYSKGRDGTFLFNHWNQFKTQPIPQQNEEISFLIQAVIRSEDNQLRSRFFSDGLRLVNAGVPVSFYVVILDSATGRLIQSKRFEATPNNYQIPELISYLEISVKENQIVTLFTFHHKGQSFNTGQFTKGENHQLSLGKLLKKEGATAIDVFLQSGKVPYLLVYQKGKGIIKEIIGDEPDEKIETLLKMSDWLGVNYSYTTDSFGPSNKWDSVHLSRELSELRLYGIDQEGKNEEGISVSHSSRLDRPISQKSYLSFELDEPINNLEIEFFGSPKSERIYRIFLEQDTLIEGEPVGVMLNGLIANTTSSSMICFSLIGAEIERDTCVEFQFYKSFSFIYLPVQLWKDIPSGNYQLVSDWNGQVDSLPLNIQPYNRFPELSFLINGEEQVPMQSFKSGKKISLQVKSRNNHFSFEHNPTMAVEVRLKDAEGELKEIGQWWEKMEVNTEDNGVTLQLDGTIEVARNGIYTVEIIPKSIKGLLLENLKETAIVDVYLPYGVEKINFFPNPFSGQQGGISFNYWGDQLPVSFTVGILNIQGSLIDEVDLVQTGQIQMGRNVIPEIFGGGKNEVNMATGVYYYHIKVNNDLTFSGKVIILR